MGDQRPCPPNGTAIELHRLRASLKSALFGRAPEDMHVDRFVVREQIGTGGMGIVYAAYDPQLDRTVALKLLRTETGPDADRARLRLLREAQAMARLSHPNVVQVYQAGLHEGRVFLAMELIAGCTLRAWQEQRRRPWREVVSKYVQAARGLSAAHTAGLVHRDFKPANVLVETGGRVCVTDFGTARSGSVDPIDGGCAPNDARVGSDHVNDCADERATAEDPQSAGPDPAAAAAATANGDVHNEGTVTKSVRMRTRRTDPPLGTPAWTDRMTKTGSMVGTPAYMSPEQHAGVPLDARSDQFGFCIALHEALFGELPFAGQTRAALAASVLAEDVRPPPPNHDVPTRIAKAIRRGLSRDPNDRFSSMDALIGQLVGPRPKATRIVVAAALVSSLAAWIPMALVASPSCTEDNDAFADSWSVDQRARLATRFDAMRGTALWPVVRDRVDRYVDAWQHARVDACTATHVEHRQSEQALDLRMWCLDQRRATLEARLESFGQLTKFEPGAVLAAADDLPELSTCANVDLLREGYRPPHDTDQQQAVDRVSEQVTRAIEPLVLPRADLAPEQLGPTVLKDTQQALRAAEALGYPPVIAQARFALGRATFRFGEPEVATQLLMEAAAEALASRHTTLVVQIWNKLARTHGTLLGNSDRSREYLDLAMATLERHDEHGELYADLLLTAALVHTRAANYEDALAAVDETIAIAMHGPRTDARRVLLAKAKMTKSNILDERGDVEQALAAGRKALAEASAVLGPRDLQTAAMRFNVVLLAKQLGQYELAATEFDRVRAQYLRYYGATHIKLGRVHALAAELARATGDTDSATQYARTAIATYDRKLDPDNPRRAAPRRTLAEALLDAGEPAHALDAIDEAIALRFGDTSVPSDVAYDLSLRARARLAVGNTAGAAADAAETLALVTEHGLRPALAGSALLVRGAIELAANGFEASTASLRAARAHLSGLGADGTLERGEVEFALARAAHRLESHDDCENAIRSALAHFRELPLVRRERYVAAVERWRAENGHIHTTAGAALPVSASDNDASTNAVATSAHVIATVP